MENDDFYEISTLYKEAQLALLFEKDVKDDEHLPLMLIEDMFLEHNNRNDKPFALNILMQKADDDLDGVIKDAKSQPLSFQQFFPIFRDCILGLCFIHKMNIAHRDIKPGNIMVETNPVNGQKNYLIADYGCGVNLSYI